MSNHISQENMYALLRVLAPYALEALKTSVGPAQLKRDIEEAQSLGPRDNERLFTLLDNIRQGALALVRDLPASRIIEQAMMAVSHRQEARELPLDVLHKIIRGQQALLDGQRVLLARTTPVPDIALLEERAMPGAVQVQTAPLPEKVLTTATLRRQEQAKACVAANYTHWVQRWPHLFAETAQAKQDRDVNMSLNEQGARGRRLNFHRTTDYDQHYTKDPYLPGPFWKNGADHAPPRAKDRVAWWYSLPRKIKFQILLVLPFDDTTLT